MRESLDDRRLPDSRLANQDRVVLLAPRQHLHHALNFLRAPNRRIELAFGGELREIAAEVIERWRLGFLLALGLCRLGSAAPLLRRRTTLRRISAEDAQRFRTRRFEIDTRISQHLRGNSLFFAQESEQQMLGADITVIQLARLAHGELEHLLCARGIRKVRPSGLGGFPLFDRFFDFLLNLIQLDAEILQHGGRDALTLTDEAKQDMLGPHVLVVEARGLLSRHSEDLPHPLGEVVAVHVSLNCRG